MKLNNLDALYNNWANNHSDNEEIRQLSDSAEQQVEALVHDFNACDNIFCAYNEYASACERRGFFAGFRAAVDLIVSGGVLPGAGSGL